MNTFTHGDRIANIVYVAASFLIIIGFVVFYLLR